MKFQTKLTGAFCLIALITLAVPASLLKQDTVAGLKAAMGLEHSMVPAALLSGFMALSMGLFMGRLLGRPMGQLAAGLAKVARGDWHTEIQVTSGGEVGEMAHAVNSLVHALRMSEAQLRSLADNLPNGMVYQVVRENDGRMRFLYVSAGVERLHGFTAREVRLDPTVLYAQVIDEDRTKLAAMEQRSLETMSVFNAIIRIRRPDGELRWMQLCSAPRRLDDGRVLWDGLEIDITDRECAEQALRASEEKYRNIFDSAVEGLFRLSPDGGCLSANPALARMHGFESPDEMMRAAPEGIGPFTVDPTSRLRLIAPLSRHGRIDNHEFQVRRRDGSLSWLVVTARAVCDPSGRVAYFEGSCLDISERKRMQTLEAAKTHAEAANRAKSVFLANMSHEIRTRMNAMLGFSQLMMRDVSLTAAQREHLRVIDTNGAHLLTLINDILEMSKIEAKRATLAPTRFSLRTLANDMEVLFGAWAEARGLHFVVNLGRDIPEHVMGDAGKLRQILVNLLDNAVKFTGTGSVILRLQTEHQGTSIRLKVEVEDTGPGIPANEMNLLFKYYEQTALGRRSGSGTGLGLAISREFARLMGGDITVESKVDVGTIFRMHARLAAVDAATSATESLPEPMPFSHSIRLAGGQKEIRVLVVDDLADSRNLLRQLLSGAGFQVREAANGAEALQEFESWQPQCVLMDLRMPVLGGLEAIRAIRQQEGPWRTKIVSVTADAFHEDSEQVLAAGADACLPKPVRATELFGKLEQLLAVRYIQSKTWLPSEAVALRSAIEQRTGPSVPPQLVRRLSRAVQEADFEQIMRLADELSSLDAGMAGRVRQMAARFEYAPLLDSLEAYDRQSV